MTDFHARELERTLSHLQRSFPEGGENFRKTATKIYEYAEKNAAYNKDVVRNIDLPYFAVVTYAQVMKEYSCVAPVVTNVKKYLDWILAYWALNGEYYTSHSKNIAHVGANAARDIAKQMHEIFLKDG